MRVINLRYLSSLLLFATCFVNGAAAQKASEEAFETASIRPVEWRMGCFGMLPPGGTHFAISCYNLRQLIAVAWGVDPDNIQGGDASAMSTNYDIRATTPGDKPWVFASARLMLQRLLIERFHLSVHSGSRKEAGYGLFIAKGGAKLKPVVYESSKDGVTAGAPSQNYITETRIQGRQVKMNVIASLLSRAVREPVEDHTEISGFFNIDLEFAPLNGADSPLPSFFSAVEDQLGLKLKPETVTIPTLVVDHVDSAPTPN